MDILPLILFILFAVVKGSSKKKHDTDRIAQKKRTFEEANQFVSRNMAVPGQGDSAAKSGEYGEYAGFESGPSMEGTAPKAPSPPEKRRPAAAVRPVAAPAGPSEGEELGGGWGSLQGFTSIEAEVGSGRLHTAATANKLNLAGRFDSALEPAFDDQADDSFAQDKPLRAGKRPSLAFARDPVVNGIIWSEILERPQKRRR